MAVATKCCKTRFLCLFAQEHVDFRIQVSHDLIFEYEMHYNSLNPGGYIYIYKPSTTFFSLCLD